MIARVRISVVAGVLATASACDDGSSGSPEGGVGGALGIAPTGASADAAGGTTQEPSPTGGGGGNEGGAGNAVLNCTAEGEVTDPTALIDDFEDVNANLPTSIGYTGGWWVYGDGSGGSIVPPADSPPTPERILGGRCESDYALHVTAQGFTDWGAGLSATFLYADREQPFDVRRFRGVRFWARAGQSNTSQVRVQFQDAQTHPAGELCATSEATQDQCYDAFGIGLPTLSTEWRLFEIDFSTTFQRGFGLQVEKLDLEHVFDVEFVFDANAIVDFWVDDLYFLPGRVTAPPDAGAPDAGAPDAGPDDASAPDAGPDDASAPDAGPDDASAPDAGPDDVAPPTDAGEMDDAGL
jgi:hypothetical protein